ncbi:uncharacterized protein LOC132559542 [Ylistrum balloti]|uniref:uncharacterized protein LOC132559542 n=1 Tax=Ylistrum balloti TaxID=509963 RepID=UPI0029059C42|nr:uncharacterized protein LOC132559542 [Ylistrum balloti]
MWMCRNILPEYLMYAILPEANGGGFWACNNSANPHDWRPFVPCMFASENFQEIRPLPNTVATILGQDMTSGYLYGINNNGLGYVYSRNGGHNWISIPENVYIRAFNLPDFRMATLI